MSVVKLHHGDPIEAGITALQSPLMTLIIPKHFWCFLRQHRDALTIYYKILVTIHKFLEILAIKILDQKISTKNF